jgi:hypothetical protein
MRDAWKLFWDIAAVALGGYAAWNVFLYSGDLIPAFGYFPIGLFAGLLSFGIVGGFVHLIELPIDWIIWKILKIKMADDLPFD